MEVQRLKPLCFRGIGPIDKPVLYVNPVNGPNFKGAIILSTDVLTAET